MTGVNNKALFYVLIFVLVFFLLIDFVSLFFVRRNFSFEYYTTDVIVGFSEIATITTFGGLRFKDVKKREEFMRSYGANSKKNFEEYFSKISRDIGREVNVLNVESTATSRDTLLEITETVTLSGLVRKYPNGKFEAGLGKIRLSNIGNSQLRVKIPREAELELADPTPTRVNRNVLVWEGLDILYFPNVVYKKGEGQ
uniref:DUF4897 domain-containing protein n=1 Tax=Fervidobacterium thailandense TaxID=1008305 RepID=A0A7C4GKX6_9BACT